MSLFAALDRVPDSRQPGGKRHRLQSVLALAVCGMLRGCKGLYAIAPWGRDHAGDVAGWLGFGRHGTPCVATLPRIGRVSPELPAHGLHFRPPTNRSQNVATAS